MNGRDARVDYRRGVTGPGVDLGRAGFEKCLGKRASQTSIGAGDQRDLSSDIHPRPFKLANLQSPEQKPL